MGVRYSFIPDDGENNRIIPDKDRGDCESKVVIVTCDTSNFQSDCPVFPVDCIDSTTGQVCSDPVILPTTDLNEYLACILNGYCEDYVSFDDSFSNNEKANCVYDQLNDVCGNLFNETIGQFQNNPDLHLNWQISNSISSNGQTSDLTDNTITITLGESYVNNNLTSHIRLAKTILHEAIHANIKASLAEEHTPAIINDWEFNYLIEVYKHYESQKPGNDHIADWADHYFMSIYYIEPLANALWELNNHQGDVDNYLWFAWDGVHSDYTDYISDDQMEEYRLLSLEINQNLPPCD